MVTIQNIKQFVESYSDSNLSEATKLESYTRMRCTLEELHNKGDAIEDENLVRCLFEHVHSDLYSTNIHLRRSALSTLELLYKCKWKNYKVPDLPEMYIKFAFDCTDTDNSDLRGIAERCVRCALQELIKHNNCDLSKILLTTKTDTAIIGVLDSIAKILMGIPLQEGLIFYYEKLIPCLLKTDNASARIHLLELAEDCLSRYPVTALGETRLGEFKNVVKDNYTQRLKDLQTVSGSNWNKLWMFLIKCLSPELFSKSFLNHILKVLEVAFRSVECETVFAAYDCWKTLIDICSLDPEQMCQNKRAKLLVVPIRVASKKNVLLSKKKLEVWMYLLNALKERASTSYIQPFLNFCFGPLCENPLVTRGNTNNLIQSDTEFWQQSTQALLCILGHYGHDQDNCINDEGNKPLLALGTPAINNTNFMNFDYIIINSVGECCSILIHWMDKSNRRQVVTCLWSSLFNIISQLDKADQEKSLRRITALLAVYVEMSDKQSSYFEDILEPIFDLLLQNKLFHINILKFSTQLLFPIVKELIKYNTPLFSDEKLAVLKVFHYSKSTSNKDIWFKKVFDIFCTVEVKETNIRDLLALWKECTTVLNDICESPTGLTENVIQSTVLEFMVWPVLHLDKVVPELYDETINEFSAKWGMMFAKLYETYVRNSLVILEKLRDSIKTSSNTVPSIAELSSQFHPLLSVASPNSDFLSSLLNLTSHLLAVQPSTKRVIDLLSSTVVLILEHSVRDNGKILKNSDFRLLCQCFEYFLLYHKEYTILEHLLIFFDKIPNSFKNNIPASLLKAIKDLPTDTDDTISKTATNLLSALSNFTLKSNETLFMQPPAVKSSRAARIANMAIKPKSPKKNKSPGEATILNLFGHKVQTPSPVRIRGSQLKVETKQKKRTAAEAFTVEPKKNDVAIDAGDEANYVLIDDPYKFDPAKLTDHQLEVMKKRRCDIPALYQDLSQSQSNSENIANRNLSCTVQSYCEEQNNTTDAIFPGLEDQKVEDKNKNVTILKNQVSNSESEDLFATESLTFSKVLSTLKKDDTPTKLIENDNYTKGNKKEEKLKQIEKAETVCNNMELKTQSTVDIISTTTISNKENNEESLNKILKNTETDNVQTISDKIDLKIQNPSMNQIKVMINEDLTQNINGPLKMQNGHNGINNCAEGILENIDTNSNLKTLNDLSSSTEGKRKIKILNEMKKLKMDIVGGDRHLQDLDSERKLRTRSKDPPAKSDSKTPDDSDDSKNPNTNGQRLKMQKRERRKSIGSPKKSDDIRLSSRSPPPLSENNITPIIAEKASKTRRSLLDEISNCGTSESEMNKNGIGIKSILVNKINEVDANKDNQKNVLETKRKAEMDISNQVLEVNKNDINQEKPKKRRRKSTSDITNIFNSESDVTKEIPKQKKRRSLIDNEANTSTKKLETNNVVKLKQRRCSSEVAIGDNSDTQKKTQRGRRKSIRVIESSSSVNKSEKEKIDPNNHRIRSPKKIEMNDNSKKPGSLKRTKMSELMFTNSTNSLQNNIEERTINENGHPKKIKSNEIEIPNKEKLLDTLDENTNSLKLNPLPEIFNRKRTSKVRKCLTSVMDSYNRSEELSQIEKISDLTVIPVTHFLPNSEDIIESSQKESCSSVSSYSETVANTNKDIKETESTNQVVADLEVIAITEKSKTVDIRNTQSTDNELSITNISMYSPDQLMEMDLAGNKNEKDISEMDTLTLGIEETSQLLTDNSEKNFISIPSSPLAPDTPTRTSELINNTVDISPIKSTEIEQDSDKTSKTLETDNNDSASSKIENVNKAKLISSSLPGCSSSFNKGNTRAERLLAMVSHTPSPKNYKIRKIKSLDSNPYSIFLKTNRIIKMMQTYGVRPDSEDISVIEDDGEPHLISEEDVLEFTKELPSPKATPKFSILKRKTPETGSEGLSPPRKKRVNFTDPPTTCEKIYYNIKEEEETLSEDQATQIKSTEGTENQKPGETDDLQKIPNGQEITTSATAKADEFGEFPVFQEVEIITSSSDNLIESDIESLGIETQGSVDNTNVTMLNQYNPIVPELTDCNESINDILEKITTPVFMTHLQNQLENKMIFTIGDLARLTEAEVMRLPFKTPKIKGVQNALLEYYQSYKKDIIKMSMKNAVERNQGIKVIPERIFQDNQGESSKSISSQSVSTTTEERGSVSLQNISTKENNSHLRIQALPLSPSTSSNVKIISSFVIEPARKLSPTVSQKNTEASSSSIGKTVKQVQSSEPLRPKISHDKELSRTRSRSPLRDKNVEERNKLQLCMTELIEDFERIKGKAKQQGLHLSSLYELILEVVGIENYISVLQENKALTIDHLIKDDKDWNTVTSDMIQRLGLHRIIALLSGTLNLTPARFALKVFETLPNDINKDSTLERIACYVLRSVPLQNVLRNFGMYKTVNALYEMKRRSADFTVEDFFLHATFKFSPNINDMVPCFKNIKTVQVDNTILEITDENKKDLNTFVEKVSTVVHKRVTKISEVEELVKDFPVNEKQKLTLALFYGMPCVKQEECARLIIKGTSLEQQQTIITEVVDHMWKLHPDVATALLVNKLVQGQEKILFDVVTKLSLSKQEKLTYTMVHKASLEKQKELAFSIFDKMSDADVFDCFSNYFRKRLHKK